MRFSFAAFFSSVKRKKRRKKEKLKNDNGKYRANDTSHLSSFGALFLPRKGPIAFNKILLQSHLFLRFAEALHG
ncbi:MAG: hypothetical protein IJR78_02530, partial [Clostridia bacterium]|nr:hypothetical protein [Clostridia bacterium]